jgi:alkylhydroperoxidase/carboxymuconolactone decarboxylase family protein YurZ
VTTGKEAELERTTRLRGFRYGLHDFLAEVDLNALKAVNDHVEANYVNESLLDRRTKELLIMVACVAQGDLVSHLQIHMHAAHKAGATPEEIMEALNLVGSWIGIRRVLGLEAWRATFRPDIPTIDRVVELK